MTQLKYCVKYHHTSVASLRQRMAGFNRNKWPLSIGIDGRIQRNKQLTVLQTKESMIDVENILPDGFDYKGHLNNPSRTRWGDRELVADICHSLGNEFFNKGELNKALENYNISIHLNPNYEKAHLNKAILLDKMESGKKASTIERSEIEVI